MRIEKENFFTREAAQKHQDYRNQWEDRYGRGITPYKAIVDGKEIECYTSEVEVYG